MATSEEFYALFPKVQVDRVRNILRHRDFGPLRALFALGDKLKGGDKVLLDEVWPVVTEAVRLKMVKAGFNGQEIAAAYAVQLGSAVLPPK